MSRRTMLVLAVVAGVGGFAPAHTALRAQAGTNAAPALDEMADGSARTAVRAILASAPSRGIPVEPLLTKVREGITKRSDPDRIRDAVQGLATRLETAKGALAPSLSTAELSAGAGALQAGVPVNALRTLRRAWSDRPLTVPLGVLTEMVADGVPAGSATSTVKALMERNVSSVQLVQLGASVRADIAAGSAPGRALEQRGKSVLSQLVAPFNNTIVGPASPPLRPGKK